MLCQRRLLFPASVHRVRGLIVSKDKPFSQASWYRDAWWISAGVWVAVVVGVFEPATRSIVGGQVFILICALAMTGLVFSRFQLAQTSERIVAWSFPVGALAILLTVDWPFVAENGFAIQYTAIGGLVGAFYLGARRTR